VAAYRPLGRMDEGVRWVSETDVAPWVIWVLRPRMGQSIYGKARTRGAPFLGVAGGKKRRSGGWTRRSRCGGSPGPL
jgi:hypothetical protein